LFLNLQLNIAPTILTLVCIWLGSKYGYEFAISVIFIFFAIYFLIKLTREINITYLMSLLAIFQWLVGSLVYYSDLNPGMTFKITIMQVNYDTYFEYAFPGTLAFVLGLNLLKIKNDFFGNLKFKYVKQYLRTC
jgi:hypothetical protein